MNKRGHITDKEEWDIANKGRVQNVQKDKHAAAIGVGVYIVYT
jgi:hypothetical protein